MANTKKTTTVKTVNATPKVDKTATTKTVTRATGLSVPVYSLAGKESGNMDLPKEVFGAKVNMALLTQALRVYTNNEKAHYSHTKTRGEVAGSTAKMGAQKGGGRARHGAKRAPIYVGGGIALGPKSRKVELDLPQKMRKAALASALSQRVQDKSVFGLAGLDKATGKTKELASFAKAIQAKSVLMVIDQKTDNAQRAAKNLPGVHMVQANQLNAYEVIKHQTVVLTKEAVAKLGAEGAK